MSNNPPQNIFDTSSLFAVTITFIVAPGSSCSFILIKVHHSQAHFNLDH